MSRDIARKHLEAAIDECVMLPRDDARVGNLADCIEDMIEEATEARIGLLEKKLVDLASLLNIKPI